MLNSVIEYTALGFGLLGCAVLGTKAMKRVEDAGGSTIDQLATGAVVGAVGAAVMPITAVIGVAYTAEAGYKYYKEGKPAFLEHAKAKYEDLKDQVTQKLSNKEPETA